MMNTSVVTKAAWGLALALSFFVAPAAVLAIPLPTPPEATITLIKNVRIDSGSGLTAVTSDFPMTLDGTALPAETVTVPPAGVVSSSTTVITTTPGTHTFDVASTPSGFVGAFDAAGPCSIDGEITVADGDAVTCTLIIDDVAPQPVSLSFTQTITNDESGTATDNNFEIFLDGSTTPLNLASSTITALPGGGTQGISVTSLLVTSNVTHTFTFAAPPGYAATFSNDCPGGVITPGVILAHCSIFFDDNINTPPTTPTVSITLFKSIASDNGGTATAIDFPVLLDGVLATENAGSTFSIPGGTFIAQVTNFNVLQGNHVLTFPTVAGYTLVVGPGPCADGVITAADGLGVACFIAYNDIAPAAAGKALLSVVTQVLNDNSGNKQADDFTVNVSGINASPASSVGSNFEQLVDLDAGVYSVTTQNDPEYSVSFSTDCTGNVVIGDSKTCVITLDDVPPGGNGGGTVVPPEITTVTGGSGGGVCCASFGSSPASGASTADPAPSGIVAGASTDDPSDDATAIAPVVGDVDPAVTPTNNSEVIAETANALPRTGVSGWMLMVIASFSLVGVSISSRKEKRA